MTRFEIAGRTIGSGHPTYVVAEMSANHGQRLATARQLVHAAAAAGADAIKLQTYRPDTITLEVRTEPFRIDSGTLWDGTVLHDLYARAFTPWEWYEELAQLAADEGLHCFSSPFDPTAVEFLETRGAPAYKVASFELVDIPLLRRIAATGKPVILSTGMATLAEIDEAVETVEAVQNAGAGSNAALALLRTNSGYPADPSEVNLRSMAHLAERYGVVVGLSDHTLGIAVPIAAVALGACIIEKHLTLSRDMPSPDAAFSLEPAEFSAMVEAVRTAERALGEARFGPTPREQPSLQFRRSLFVVEDISAGEVLTGQNVRSIRPADGLHPRHLDEVLGRRAKRDIVRGTPLSWDALEGGGVTALSLRPAAAADAGLLLHWANDPVTRAASFATAPIEPDEHATWYERVMDDAGCALFIAMHGSDPVAQVRLEHAESGSTVSISVAPRWRRRGVGRATLQLVQSRARELGVERLRALVRTDNQASVALFRAVGFGAEESVTHKGVAALQLTWTST